MASPQQNFLDETIQISKKAFRYVFIFSMAANFLMMALPLYTLQVLDRVVSSGSMETLFWLTVLMFGLFAAFGAFQAARSFTLVKIGEWFDDKVSSRMLSLSLATSALIPIQMGSQNLRDINTLKSFLTGPGLNALMDAPWSIIYLIVIYFIHPVLFAIALGGSVLLLFAGILNERATKNPLGSANEMSIKSMQQVERSSRNSEVIEAMGMTDDIIRDWSKRNREIITLQSSASYRSAIISSFAKSARMMLQILIIGAGATLALNEHMTVGGMIAGSILMGRVLAPFEMAIQAWGGVNGAIKSYQRLKKAIEFAPQRQQSMQLPRPEGQLTVEKVVFSIPGTNTPIIKGASFGLRSGESLGIIGPSAAGKSTLAKLMVGVWKPNSGEVRLDNANVYTWNRKDFGQHVGYLPQDVELFEGTVRDNIARLRDDATDEDVVAAARMSGAHEFILRLPDGYETQIAPGGSNLSAGQRQRIGLARAFYGDPRMIILDEPNSNLDESGESALVGAIKNAKNLGITLAIVSHRPSVLNYVDKILVMRDGMVADFGPAKEIIAKYNRTAVGGQPGAQQIQQQTGNPARGAARVKPITPGAAAVGSDGSMVVGDDEEDQPSIKQGGES